MPELILSLICDPQHPALDDSFILKIGEALKGADFSITIQRPLSSGIAHEFHLTAEQSTRPFDSLVRTVKAELGERPVDVNVLEFASSEQSHSPDGRRKRLLVADMDSTIIEQECIDEIADFAGIKSDVAAITECTMRGELDLETSLRQRVGLLKGLSADVLQTIVDERITLTPGAKTLASTMAASGARLVLASSGFTFFTGRVAKLAGFHEDHSNTLGIADGMLTGVIDGAIYGGPDKAKTLQSVRDQLDLDDSDTLAVGDGANDLNMLAKAGTGIAFRAKPAVAAAADCQINHGDLTALLFLQGYTDREFVAAR